MTFSNGNYFGITAQLYDLWFSDGIYKDADFYRRRIKEVPGKVLEVGCGTGRLLLPYLKEGMDIEGIDCSADMLAICQSKAERLGLSPSLYTQYLQTLKLSHYFNTILVPCGTFMILTNREEAIEALERLYSHLEPNGQLLISLYVPWDELVSGNNQAWMLRRTATRPEDGARILCHKTVTLNVVEQLQTSWYRFEIYKNDECIQTHLHILELRWYYIFELQLMLEKAGFHDAKVYADYSEFAPVDFKTDLIFQARK